jgi:HAE1 family hydrophobic/amphiphilic exporter-1
MLVDDAIVVVENVERIMSEEGLSPREATKKSMGQITSALIGIGLVLSAVFGPMAFFPGSTGIIYRQFSITIVTSMMLSVVVALVLTPVLCASLLRPVPKGHEPSEHATPLLRPFLLRFDRGFFWVRDRYLGIVGHSLAKKFRYLFMYAVLLTGIGYLLLRLPTSFLPDEDQGMLFTIIMTPTGTTLEQTQLVANQVRDHFLQNEKDAVQSVLTVVGFGFSGRAQNNGLAFVKLRDWKQRDRVALRAKSVAGRAMGAFFRIRNALVFAVQPPAVNELGNARGVDFQLLDRGGLGHEAMMQARNMFMGLVMQDKRLANVRPNGLEDVPQYRVDVDWDKAGALGVPISSIHNTLATAFGSGYVNNFIQAGRVKRVYVQADSQFRRAPSDLEKFHVRNKAGQMVPFSSFASAHWTSGSPRLERFNGFPSMNFQGEPGPGHSTGEAMKAMEEAVAKLPAGVGYDWTGISFQERQASSQAPLLYGFSILVIFLCVAALYESWTIPFVNLLMIPLGVFGALLATSLRLFPNDVYFQIGFLTTMGLSTKNAILIIQFIKEQMRHGMGLEEATLSAVRIRFRPVIMTSLAFFFGTLPLALATGAGAGAMNAIGTAVTGGMLSATFIDLIFIPLFFVLISRWFARKKTAS